MGTRITKKRVSPESDIDTLPSDASDNTPDDSQPSESTDNNGVRIIDGKQHKAMPILISSTVTYPFHYP
jgi:hypothetical protein